MHGAHHDSRGDIVNIAISGSSRSERSLDICGNSVHDHDCNAHGYDHGHDRNAYDHDHDSNANDNARPSMDSALDTKVNVAEVTVHCKISDSANCKLVTVAI